MRNFRELVDKSLATNLELQAYRTMLANAGVPQPDAERAVLGKSGILGIPSELRASRQVAECVEKAIFLGIENTDGLLIRAAQIAQDEGRAKIGFFGRAGQVIYELERRVRGKETEIYTHDSRTKK